MSHRLLILALGLLSPASANSAGKPGHNPPQKLSLQRVSRPQLHITEGALAPSRPEAPWRVDVPKLRAVVPSSKSSVAELRFTYLGPTNAQRSLASGEMRRQVGLKLRAQDGCNVAYVMWRLAPKPGLVVSIKSNPRQHTSSDCGNRGYINVRPRQKAHVPPLESGDTHVLRAELEGLFLRVLVDGTQVWEGELPPVVLAFQGPVGLRTDNGRFDLELFTQPP